MRDAGTGDVLAACRCRQRAARGEHRASSSCSSRSPARCDLGRAADPHAGGRGRGLRASGSTSPSTRSLRATSRRSSARSATTSRRTSCCAASGSTPCGRRRAALGLRDTRAARPRPRRAHRGASAGAVDRRPPASSRRCSRRSRGATPRARRRPASACSAGSPSARTSRWSRPPSGSTRSRTRSPIAGCGCGTRPAPTSACGPTPGLLDGPAGEPSPTPCSRASTTSAATRCSRSMRALGGAIRAQSGSAMQAVPTRSNPSRP